MPGEKEPVSALAIGGVGQQKPPLKGKQKKGDDLFNEHLPRSGIQQPLFYKVQRG